MEFLVSLVHSCFDTKHQYSLAHEVGHHLIATRGYIFENTKSHLDDDIEEEFCNRYALLSCVGIIDLEIGCCEIWQVGILFLVVLPGRTQSLRKPLNISRRRFTSIEISSLRFIGIGAQKTEATHNTCLGLTRSERGKAQRSVLQRFQIT